MRQVVKEVLEMKEGANTEAVISTLWKTIVRIPVVSVRINQHSSINTIISLLSSTPFKGNDYNF